MAIKIRIRIVLACRVDLSYEVYERQIRRIFLTRCISTALVDNKIFYNYVPIIQLEPILIHFRIKKIGDVIYRNENTYA
jgi:hypothetical protein